jgi:hypothetical protein
VALQGVHKLLRLSEVASFEDIADLKTKLDAIRKKFKKEQLDEESSQHIGEIQSRIDGLLSQLAGSMKKK